jgi:hypothetical protein
MPQANPRAEPFTGYRIALAQATTAFDFADLPSQHPDLATLLAGRRPDTLTAHEARDVFDAAERAANQHGLRFPLRFTPVRCGRSSALGFPALALSATEILYLVHDGLFGSARCRAAAIAATAACGALPVPAVGLKPLRRGASQTEIERHVDLLIEREAEVRAHSQVAGRRIS